ncbi:MAG: AI-2E family transporter [Oscillospiraceae bacterium]|nr:AI-2E family transporter [Oscillospiraceae bacterium]
MASEYPNKVEQRRGHIINFLYYALILLAFYLFMRYVFWLAFPFLFAFFVALILQKPMNYAHRKIRLKKSFSAVALVLLFYIAIAAVISLIGIRLVNGAKDFITYLSSQVDEVPRLIEGLQHRIQSLVHWLPDALELRFNNWMDGLVKSLLAGKNTQGETVGLWGSLTSHINFEWFRSPVNGVLDTAKRLPAVLVAAVITVVASFFMTGSYDRIVGFLKRQLSPPRQRALSAGKWILISSLGKLVRSYATIMGVTFAEFALGLGLLRLIGVYQSNYFIAMAMLIAALDILPVLGSGMIVIPWALYSLVMGEVGLGVGLLAILAVVIVVRQIIEPKLVASNLGLLPIVTLAGMYIGLQLFGMVGMFVLPLLLILVKLLNDDGVIHLWTPGVRRGAESEPKKPAPKPPFRFPGKKPRRPKADAAGPAAKKE